MDVVELLVNKFVGGESSATTQPGELEATGAVAVLQAATRNSYLRNLPRGSDSQWNSYLLVCP